ncbi:hypothetical protein [Enorma burkinafasonensis]|uniref:hypothetical protein n=1 Tax=Enorma burkinafasonensis TaxID=2590867 RepID=UPI0011A4C23E|nr:hypothetical protein [Enorma burkinafasonensis]
MKARVVLAFTALACLASLALPQRALAAGNEYTVGSKEAYEQAVADIKANVEEGSEVTFVLTADLGLTSANYQRAPVEFGIEGYDVTYTSDGNGPWALGAKSYYLQCAVGDVTFDDVWLAVGQHAQRDQGTVSSFYAQGHTVEFAENFDQPIAQLYGGSKGGAVESTHLIINGDVIGGVGSSTAQNWHVYGGGCYSGSGTSSTDGLVRGDVTIDLGPNSRAPWVYGGGKDAQVGGNVTVNLRGDASDADHHIGNITGGGSVTDDGPASSSYPGRYAGVVLGDITLNLESGRTAGVASGGSYVSSGGDQGQAPEDIQALNDRYARYNYYFLGTVAGNVNVIMGREGDDAGTLVLETTVNNSGGSTYSVIQGDVSLVVNDGAQMEDLQGMGRNDIVEGTVAITVNGGVVEGTVWGLGEAWYSSDGAHEVGRGDDENTAGIYLKDAVTVTVNGGEVGSIAWFEQYLYDGRGVKYGTPQIYGNVTLNVNGGTVGRVYAGNPADADPTGWESGHVKLAYVRGDRGIELHVRGGEITGLPSVYAHELNTVYRGQRIYFENDAPVRLYQIVGANARNNEDFADAASESAAHIVVKNTAPATLMYYENSRGTAYPVFGPVNDADETCGSIDVQSGTLAMAGEATILGDLTVHEGGTLAMPSVTATEGFETALNVRGEALLADTAAGGSLKTTDAARYDWSSGSWRIYPSTSEVAPEVGEVFVRSQKTNEPADAESDAELLGLVSEPGVAAGLYVEYTQESEALSGADGTTYAHAWRIAKGEVPEPDPVLEITLTSQDMVAYTGGDSLGGDSFPATRYEVTATLDGAATDMDLSDVAFTVNGDERTLPDGTQSGDVVVLPWVPDTFTLADASEMDTTGAVAEGDAATDDVVAGDYAVAVDVDAISAEADGYEVTVEADAGELTVRDVSKPEDVAAGSADVAQPVVGDAEQVDTADGIGMAVIAEGTEFFTNGQEELGLLGDDDSDSPQVALLFDELLPGDSDEDTAQLLRDRAGELGHELTAENSEFRYLDLVNENDGNAWVSTQDGATIEIHWPVPAGVDPEAVEFSVLHFQNLHREYRDNLGEQVAACPVEVIDARVEGGNVVFTLTGDQDEGCFSPFALTWTQVDDGEEPGGEQEPGDGEEPGGEQPGGGQQPDGTQPGQQAGKPAGSGADAGTLAATGDSTPVVIGAVLAAGAAAVAVGVALGRRSAQR